MIDGILIVDKPVGLTSHDVVQQVRRWAGQRRVGHLGTLDPLATGVLPIALGEATKLSKLLTHGDKAYSGSIRLGVETTTYDREGDVVVIGDAGTAIGASKASHDLTALEGHRLRSHGSIAERRVPFIISVPLSGQYAARAKAGPLRSYEIFDYAINGTE